MNKIFWTLDIILYLIIILSTVYKIFKFDINRRIYLAIDIFIIIVLSTYAFEADNTTFTILCTVMHIVQIVLIRASVPNLRFYSLITLYTLIYSVNSVLVVAINSLIPLSTNRITIVEFIVHIFITLCFTFCSLNNTFSYKIKQSVSIVPAKIKFVTVFSFCTSTILMALILANPEMDVNSPWSISVRIALVFFSLFVCTTFPILIITVLTNTYLKKQNESFELQIEVQAAHYIALAESNKELRRFKHDFKNLRIGITKALTSGDCEIALEMIENGQNDFIQATDSIVKYNTGNGIVDAILSEKQKKAIASNTIISFEGILPQTGFSPTDLCVIFGNTLDNAIEACEKISGGENKIISVSVTCTNGFIFITITNPVSEKVIVHNNHIDTTKKDRTSHGFGLYSLQKIAKKYKGEMSITSEDHTFTISLELCL